MNQTAQRSVFGRPWYWILIGAGLAVIGVLIALTISTAAGAEDSQPAPSQESADDEDAPAETVSHGDGTTFDAPLEPGTDIEMVYGNDFDGDGADATLVDVTATIRITDVDLDATADALAEDPWADLMLDRGEKLAIVGLDVTNNADDPMLSLLLAGELMLEDASGAEYDMDITQVALEQTEVPNADFPQGETVHVAAVYMVPDDADASNTVVRLETNTDVFTYIAAE